MDSEQPSLTDVEYGNCSPRRTGWCGLVPSPWPRRRR